MSSVTSSLGAPLVSAGIRLNENEGQKETTDEKLVERAITFGCLASSLLFEFSAGESAIFSTRAI